ncbi:MAG: DNA-deoxyinosine glycosylase [Eubacteriales bacterium]|nr:DNA-deoxyinosine glycosylase [Eubacteriales bacterium]
MESQEIKHPFDPVFDSNSKFLILGSFPSVKSREQMFFYGHPRNRFWKVISTVFQARLPETIPEKKKFLLDNHIALWDVISSCEITGSSDASITNVQVNDLSPILSSAKIDAIYTNGTKAYELYMKYSFPITGIPAVKLPSTSPANAACSYDRLVSEWSSLILPQTE